MRPRIVTITAVTTATTASQPAQVSSVRPRELIMLRRYSLSGWIDPVADARLGDDDLRRCRIDLDLPTKVGDVHAEILLRAAEFATPDRVEDLLVGERAAG